MGVCCKVGGGDPPEGGRFSTGVCCDPGGGVTADGGPETVAVCWPEDGGVIPDGGVTPGGGLPAAGEFCVMVGVPNTDVDAEPGGGVNAPGDKLVADDLAFVVTLGVVAGLVPTGW